MPNRRRPRGSGRGRRGLADDTAADQARGMGLPSACPAGQDKTGWPPAGRGGGRMPETGRALRVLIVEDDSDDVLLLLSEFRRGGFEPQHVQVETLGDVARALGEPFDL